MKKLLTGFCLALSPFFVTADEDYFSAEILLGRSDQELKTDTGKINGYDDSLGFRVAYHLNSNSAIELSYHDMGETEDDYIDMSGDAYTDTIETSSINIGGKATFPFDNGVSIYGRIGLAFWDVELQNTNSSDPGIISKGDDSANDFYQGVGIQYLLNDEFTFGAEYTLYKLNIRLNDDFQRSIEDIDIATLALTAGMKF